MKVPITPAVRWLRQHGVSFTPHLYRYEEKGGTKASAQLLGVPEERVVKTLVMEDHQANPLMVLMQGPFEVSVKKLARDLNYALVKPCKPEIAQKHTGYLVGGTSPFGTRKPLPVYMERSILDFSGIYINGGKRGFLVALNPVDIVPLLQVTMVEVALG